MSDLTSQQQAAINARGNLLVAAGAGTGKTRTAVERCLQLVIEEGCSLESILMVTFTEAAAAEIRARVREALRKRIDAATTEAAEAERLSQELALLDTAPISTLHSFCLDLVRRHFHQLGLDPQISVLDEQQTAPLIHQVLDELFQRHFAAATEVTRRNTNSQGNPVPHVGGYSVRDLVRAYGRGSADWIRRLVVQIHRHTQALASPTKWFGEQIASFDEASPAAWPHWFAAGVAEWAALWRDALPAFAAGSTNVAASAAALASLPGQPSFDEAAQAVAVIVAADAVGWAYGTKGKFRDPLKLFFADAAFLHAVARNGGEGLAQDWAWVREPMLALLELAREFTEAFTRAKRELGGIDFADQEQLALRLLYDDMGRLTPVALACRERFRFVFVDECQDVNAAQDAILSAVSREGAEANRFLVGDVKQSIYRFRLADPRIFQTCEEHWKQPGAGGKFLPLSGNFRSREALLRFINPLCRALMRPSIGGVNYDADPELQFGKREERLALSLSAALCEKVGRVTPCAPTGTDASTNRAQGVTHPANDSTDTDRWPQPHEVAPRVELHMIASEGNGSPPGDVEDGGAAFAELLDLQAIEREARLIALRLKDLKDSGHRIWNREKRCFRPVDYADMVVLMRGIAGRAETFAKEFYRAGVPLHAERAGFLDSLEVTDLLSLLRLLDNPLQDVPLLAVLRSPLVGLSADELVAVRMAHRSGLMWTALGRWREIHVASASSVQLPQPGQRALFAKVDNFLQQFTRWRGLVRHSSLSHCLETALVETHYEALLLAGERGPERVANVRRLTDLARRFDPYQREGLYRFLRFIDEQKEAEVRHEPAALQRGNAVRLMTIHQSKGQEFPVVVVAGLGNVFNLRDLTGDILLQEDLGLCPKVIPPGGRRRYPSFAHWLASQREHRALLGEEMRLLYVALTRTQDTLILTGTASKKASVPWQDPAPVTDFALLKARCYLDWLRLWLPHGTTTADWRNDREGASDLLRWRIYDPLEEVFARPNAGGKPKEIIEAPASPTQAEFATLKERLAWRYPQVAATTAPAKRSVTVLVRSMVEAEEEASPLIQFRVPGSQFRVAPSLKRSGGKLSAAEIGMAHHRFLQWVSLDAVESIATLEKEAQRLCDAHFLSLPELNALDLLAVARFWHSELGKKIRANAGRVQREIPFTLRLTRNDLADNPLVPSIADGEYVVLQGVVDLAVLLPRETWLVDFKTDDVKSTELNERTQFYAPQLKFYGLALEKIFRRTVTERWLHFLSPGKTLSM